MSVAFYYNLNELVYERTVELDNTSSGKVNEYEKIFVHFLSYFLR